MAKHANSKHKEHAGKLPGGNPQRMINLVIKDKENREWATNEILYGGPPHKQAFSALLLDRMQVLVKALEKDCGVSFSLKEGIRVTGEKDGWEIPAALPFTVARKEELDALAAAVAPSPTHELMSFTILLQAVEWGIETLVKAPVMSKN